MARSVYHFRQTETYQRMRQRSRSGGNQRIVDRYLASHPVAKLQIGSGNSALPGWLNSDYLPPSPAHYHLDATKPFELKSESFDYVFSEHMIEHIPFKAALNMLKECHRILKPGGRIRVSTPPLEFVIDLVRQPGPDHLRYVDWHMATWLPDLPYGSTAVVANDFLRNWGHLFVYDEPTLRWALEQAGFKDVQRTLLNESEDPALRNLEHPDRMPAGLLALSTVTLEGVKAP